VFAKKTACALLSLVSAAGLAVAGERASVAPDVRDAIVTVEVRRLGSLSFHPLVPGPLAGPALPAALNVERTEARGVALDTGGHVLTCLGPIPGDARVSVVTRDGRRHLATVRGRDSGTGLTVLAVDATLPALPVAEAAWRETFVVAGTAAPPGHPLLDDRGRMTALVVESHVPALGRIPLGIVTGRAIPAGQARAIAAQLLRAGHVEPGSLGASLVEPTLLDVLLRRGHRDVRGVAVTGVVTGGAAARAGLRPGDVVLSLDGRPVWTKAFFERGLAAAGAGTTLRLEVLREGTCRSCEVVLGAERAP
jgi:S1-C subfamily serine protease